MSVKNTAVSLLLLSLLVGCQSNILAAGRTTGILQTQTSQRHGSLQMQTVEIRAYNAKGQRLTLLKKDTVCRLEAELKGNLETSQFFDPESEESWKEFASSVEITCKDQESFTFGKEPVLSFKGTAQDPLCLVVSFPDTKYTGNGDTLSFQLKINEPLTFDQEIKEEVYICLPEKTSEPSSVNPPQSSNDPAPKSDPVVNPAPFVPEISNELPVQPIENEEQETPQPKTAAATPYIIVDKYTYGGEQVTAGKPFELVIYFKNTSKVLPVENIMMSLETEDGLSITSSSNSFYIEKLSAGQTLSQSIQMKALGSETSSSPSITISFRYEYVDDGTRQSQTSSERISIPVIEPDRFEVTVPTITDSVFTNEETVLSFPYVNKGKGTLSNVAVTLEGDIPSLAKVQNLGNFEAGKSGTIDVVIQPDEPKEYAFTVVIAYENASGEPVELKYPFKVYAENNFVLPEDFETQPQPEENQSSLGWLWWLLAIVFIGLGGFGFWKMRRQKKNHHPASQEEDFLDDWITSLDESNAQNSSDEKGADR